MSEQKPRPSVEQTIADLTSEIEYSAAEARQRLEADGVDVDGFLRSVNDRISAHRERERLSVLTAAREKAAREAETKPQVAVYLDWSPEALLAEVQRRHATGALHATAHHNYKEMTADDLRSLLTDQDETRNGR